ncbi:MAG: efflux RND transporter periplasmic adaptor subunit [Planctomycetaceae bacterium]|nr:efflux RND transporter periplasmic adaptor subunit [Planctomycetaceae bacterium]
MSTPAVTNRAVEPRRFSATVVLLSVCLPLVATAPWWFPHVQAPLIRALGGAPAAGASIATEAKHDDHAGHDHGHAGHSEENSLELSEQARKGIGLREGVITLSTFDRTITLPGIVVERRGRSKVDVIAPMTGYVTKIYPVEGEAVVPNQPLFELRLTHEELVQAQADLLRSTEELDVVRREIARLETIGEGVIPTKTILDRKYEQQKIEAVHRAQRQALLLHGLDETQVNDIVATRVLFSTVTVHAPGNAILGKDGSKTALQVQEIAVERGRNVQAGESLAVLADHGALLIEGIAFEQDIPQITRAVAENSQLTALVETPGGAAQQIEQLSIAFVANRVDPTARTLHFYVHLPNDVIRNGSGADGVRFIDWRYKPGQRMQLRVPVETWAERIVLPAEAVAQDGVENYVFRANSDHFDRQAVRVEYRDPQSVVIANDGSLFPGERVALSAAQQLQLALKNKSGGGIDPHAGHNH